MTSLQEYLEGSGNTFIADVWGEKTVQDIMSMVAGEFVPPSSNADAYVDVISKFALFCEKFGNFIQYNGNFSSDIEKLKSDIAAVDTAFETYCTNRDDPTDLLSKINTVKAYICDYIYTRCILVENNLDMWSILTSAAPQVAIDSTIIPLAPDPSVMTEYNVNK
jgi:hypothetical protein